MKKISLLAIAVCLILNSCSSDDLVKNNDKEINTEQTTKNKESQELTNLYNEILELSLVNSQTCNNPKDWAFTAIGSKSCGGPKKYIPYSLKTNTVDFLNKVKNYTNKQSEFNTKWEVVSICDVIRVPKLVDCVNGKATLVYEETQKEEEQNLKNLYNEIVTLSLVNSQTCSNPENWHFTAIGVKSCGGPEKYIPYSLTIDKTVFFEKIETYNNAQRNFNTKWSINSICDVVPAPIGIDCVNGKATLLYETDFTEEKQNLENLYNEIITFSQVNSKTCNNPEDWAFTTIGIKPCGGPEKYIPYSLVINKATFLTMIDSYNDLENKFNQKWGMSSTCDTPPVPTSIECMNGKAMLSYK
ncbi:hypothetical protein [Flavobacterium sp. HTF]|uniref:hypothetical protein n=1 Tax=Flavobacterium sp. HTF TaxID=2170732 RepID=UPI000D5EC902|nr:hypothetical protein [Flavobacterium sp. HTF]PWB25730.1 hypothetical protein DCO46_07860 [Flavobacterium sp. HTF]